MRTTPISFPVMMLLTSIIIGAISIWKGSEMGLGFASGLTSAACTAYQYRNPNDPN